MPDQRALSGEELAAIQARDTDATVAHVDGGTWCRAGIDRRALLVHVADLERQVAEARELPQCVDCASGRVGDSGGYAPCVRHGGAEHGFDPRHGRWFKGWDDSWEHQKRRAEEAERQVAEARAEAKELRHVMIDAIPNCSTDEVDYHMLRLGYEGWEIRAEEAGRQRDALRAVALLVPKLLDAVDGIQTTVVVQEGDRFFIRESTAAWNVLHAIDGNQSDVEEAIEKLDTAWPTWREGTGGESGDG